MNPVETYPDITERSEFYEIFNAQGAVLSQMLYAFHEYNGPAFATLWEEACRLRRIAESKVREQ